MIFPIYISYTVHDRKKMLKEPLLYVREAYIGKHYFGSKFMKVYTNDTGANRIYVKNGHQYADGDRITLVRGSEGNYVIYELPMKVESNQSIYIGEMIERKGVR